MIKLNAKLFCAIPLLMAASAAWGQTDTRLPTGAGIEPVLGGVLNCPEESTGFINQFENTTDGRRGGTLSGTYSVPGPNGSTDVTISITYYGERDGDKNNSFDFVISSGYATQFVVKSGQSEFLYAYPGPVIADTGLNLAAGGAQDASNLDFCLTTVLPPPPPDTEAPVVMITAPATGAVVTGTTTVTAKVTDNVAVDPTTVALSTGGQTLASCAAAAIADHYDCSLDTTLLASGNNTVTVSAKDTSGNTGSDSIVVVLDDVVPIVTIVAPEDGAQVSSTAPVTVTATATDNVQIDPTSATADASGISLGLPTISGSSFHWNWNTPAFGPGVYTLTVNIADTSGNTGTDSISVTIPIEAVNCEGIIGDEDPDLGEGCLVGAINYQLPPDNNFQAGDTITGTLLSPDPAKIAGLDPDLLDVCSGPHAFPDPRVGADGTPFDFRPLYVFGELGGKPDPTTADDALVFGPNLFGNPCFAIQAGERNWLIEDRFPRWPIDDPATPRDERTGIVFVGLLLEGLLGDIGPIARCYGEQQDGTPPVFDLQKLGEAGYQTTVRSRMLANGAEAMTNACFNPKRKSSYDKSFEIFNVTKHCGIDFGSASGPADVVDCHFAFAEEKFEFLRTALVLAEPFLLRPKYADLTRSLNRAQENFNKKKVDTLGRAIQYLEDLVFDIRTGDWTVTEANPPGDAQGRAENLILLLKRLQCEVERQGLDSSDKPPIACQLPSTP